MPQTPVQRAVCDLLERREIRDAARRWNVGESTLHAWRADENGVKIRRGAVVRIARAERLDADALERGEIVRKGAPPYDPARDPVLRRLMWEILQEPDAGMRKLLATAHDLRLAREKAPAWSPDDRVTLPWDRCMALRVLSVDPENPLRCKVEFPESTPVTALKIAEDLREIANRRYVTHDRATG